MTDADRQNADERGLDDRVLVDRASHRAAPVNERGSSLPLPPCLRT